MNRDEPKLTTAEKARVGWLIARMAKRGIADPDRQRGTVDLSDLERRVDRVIDGARKRQEQTAKKAQ
ncbi:DUF6257 family protein [Streptomyces albipurpureus]|uniref:DUF6257 family protein n=1 Tax=Streptomyces albipurpureus TaxID=2897419 RepID=A0ABT0UVE4_9ACTN|nr:DUF6257 family protein [Streptomyces sp. CWNU-1]MCM2391328.1 DUF6257 family protein [Streptomyces sp. CWNU-1]